MGEFKLSPGIPVHESYLFNTVFPHRYELTKVLGQGETEIFLKYALDEIRLGKCQEETEAYLRSLSRECPAMDEEKAPLHIYFKRLPVDVHNAEILASLDGLQMTYKSIDTGNAKLLDKTINPILSLKPGCRVILLYNINGRLKNGYRGQLVGVQPSNDGNHRLLVDFPDAGVVSLERKTWYKYDKNGNVIGSRTQYPLSLCYAITVHKAQGLTIDKCVVVHCSQEFISGQTYVALSRVKHEANLQIIGFQKRFLLPPQPSLSDIMNSAPTNMMPGFECCKKREIDQRLVEIDDPCEQLPDLQTATGESVDDPKADFESNTADGIEITLENVLLCMMDHNDALSQMPTN